MGRNEHRERIKARNFNRPLGNSPAGNGGQPETEEKPVGELTAIAIEQHFAMVNSNAERMAAAASRADGVDVNDGWRLDFQGRRWVREKQPRKNTPRTDKPERGEKGNKPEPVRDVEGSASPPEPATVGREE